MSLPVSQYEALLAEVRGLRRKAQRVQQLATPLLSNITSTTGSKNHQNHKDVGPTSLHSYPLNYKMESIALEGQQNLGEYDRIASSVDGDGTCSEDECGGNCSTHLSVSSEPISHENRGMFTLYHGTWPVERTMWNSEPTSLGPSTTTQNCTRTELSPGRSLMIVQKKLLSKEKSISNLVTISNAVNYETKMEMTSVMSFASSSGGAPLDRVLSSPDRSRRSSQQLEAKVDMVYSLLSMLGGQEHADMGETLLALSTSPDSCLAMRQSGCIPLLVQLVQSDREEETRQKAAQALHNLVHSNPDERLKKRETRVFKLLEQIRAYLACLQNKTDVDLSILPSSEDGDNHPVQTVAHLMKLSFDEGHRQAICQLGGIYAIANLIEIEHTLHGSKMDEGHCVLLRRYSCMALTNLTFGDSGNKALLCSFKDFMCALVLQLQSPCDELRQVTASVLRNLSWRADSTSKGILKEVDAVKGLMVAAMINNRENTLKSILSALWNLSAHCTENKAEVCEVEGALAFLVNMLSYKTPSKSLAIIENAGGILRNISSQIAIKDDYRAILRDNNCLQVLLEQLKSPSLTIVSNACGTLWNLSAKNQTDQELLWQMGAPAMLRSLNHSKHKMIAMGSSAALKNLLASRPSHNLVPPMDATAKAMDLPILPTLGARKQKALLQELEQNLTDTFENVDKDSQMRINSNSRFLLEASAPSGCFTAKFHKQKPLSHTESQKSTSQSDILYEPRTSTSDGGINENLTTLANKIAEDDSFGIYAETDLDQPTNFSLKYGEDDSESEEMCNKIVKAEGNDFVQDTVKTYCTEDTPYETPFNFSTATSISDLRETGLDVEKQVIDNDKHTNKNMSTKTRTLSTSDEKDHCSVEDISDVDSRQKSSEKMLKSQYSSGLASPEKPVNYAEEGTPGYFSRVNSYGSLTSIPPNERSSKIDAVVKNEPVIDTTPEVLQKTDVLIEGKSVKFEQAVNYAEETPLMFSRSSSLASLDSIEQHSIHEDHESVISDFSRLTSGVVSPSELPDSPTQTVPPSPRLGKTAIEFPSTSKAAGVFVRTPADGKSQPALKSASKSSIFEDKITKFKEENTPVQFSTTTSLSSLTIDDHDDILQRKGCVEPVKLCFKETEETNKATQIEKRDDMPLVSESEEDEDILAACINDGMQNTRHRQNASPPSKISVSSPSTLKYQPKSPRPHTSGIPLLRARSSISSSTQIHIPEGQLQTEGGINTDSTHNYCTENTPAILSNAGSSTNLSAITTGTNINLKKEEKSYLSDDSSNLSGDNENILAECIQSAMPKARKTTKAVNYPKQMSGLPIRNIQTSSPIKPFSRIDLNCPTSQNCLPSYLAAKDETENYAIENSPCQFSVRSSLSDLTVDGCSVEGLRSSVTSQNVADTKGTIDTQASSSYFQSARTSDLQRQESLSSLSADSLGSLEQEQALLEQCISSGMPKSKHSMSLNKLEAIKPDVGIVKPVGVATKHFTNANKAHSYDQDLGEFGERDKDFIVLEEKKNSKNVNVASAVGNMTTKRSLVRLTIPTTAAGVKCIEDIAESSNFNQTKIETQPEDTLQDKCLLSEENLLTEHVKNGCDKSLELILSNSCEENCFCAKDISLERSCSSFDNCTNFADKQNELDFENVDFNTTVKAVDNRMLDPDAMIESLDRFTAELVSQAEAAHSNKDSARRFTSSITEGDTWNDDISPNDVTFPSISGSAPNVITFKSDSEDIKNSTDHEIEIVFNQNIDTVDGTYDGEQKSNDFSSINTSTMTESTLIAVEASKIATVIKNKGEMAQSITSIQSLELDCIQPPSHMNSLTNSTNGSELQLFRGSPKLNSRKKSLQTGLLARRALSNSLNHTSSLESLDNHSLSNLDYMNPPSAMGEVLDMIDLEGSMASVASLNSEVVDITLEYASNLNPIFKVKHPPNMLHLSTNNSISDLENVNPPSIFNEITDMCNSLADIATEAICSETEVFEDCNTHFIETSLQTEDDITQFSDAQSVTPFQSDLSSTETSPKKVKSLSRNFTAKQKRKLAQERYRTYTVAAEMVVSGENHSSTEDFKTVDSSYQGVVDSTQTPFNLDVINPVSGKVTPKERRQGDRARFQTQVLDEVVTNALLQQLAKTETSNKADEVANYSNSEYSQQSPGRSKFCIRRGFMQKRLENKDRFKTRTLSESSLSPDISSASPPSANSNDLQYLVQKEANRVLKKLRETKSHPDELLDCETLSLISNDEDSEHNSGSSVNYRTYTKSCSSKGNPQIDINSVVFDVKENNISHIQNKNEHTKISDPDLSSNKPKIVKPGEVDENDVTNEEEGQGKGIRGRRKPLYTKTNISNSRLQMRSSNTTRPIRSITSNLVKNVTSAIKSGTNLKNVASKQNITKPNAQVQTRSLKPPTGYKRITTKANAGRTNTGTGNVSRSSSNNGSPKHKVDSLKSTSNTANSSPSLERQGTFTKENQQHNQPKSRIPTPATSGLSASKNTSRIARAISHTNSTVGRTVTKVQNVLSSRSIKTSGSVKSVSSDRASTAKSGSSGFFSRSSSADSRDSSFNRRQNIYNSFSSQSLKGDSSKSQNGTVKRSSLTNISQRSNSNSSITSNGSSSKKQVTSKIASLWKRVEEQKKQAPKKDSRVWIQPTREQPVEMPESSRLIRSNTFESKDGVVLRTKVETSNPAKRVSRLGSFIVMDEEGDTDMLNCSDGTVKNGVATGVAF